MTLHDMNKSWLPPDGYRFVSITPTGNYLDVLYTQTIFEPGTIRKIGQNVVHVYLNDMGREVARTQDQLQFACPAPVSVPFVAPRMPRRFRFKDGFLLALTGLQEMLKCLSK